MFVLRTVVCYIGMLYGRLFKEKERERKERGKKRKREKKERKAVEMKLDNTSVFLFLPYAPPHVLSSTCYKPLSSLSQMTLGPREQELLKSERLSQRMDEWMGDHVFTLLFLVFSEVRL